MKAKKPLTDRAIRALKSAAKGKRSIVWDAIVTYAILRVIKFFTPLRMPDAELIAGDIAVHGEVAYPMEEPELAAAMIGDGTPDRQLPHEQMISD